MKLLPLALWAVITTLTAAAPTTTSNPNDPSNLTREQAISPEHKLHSSNDLTVEKRTTCNVISGDSNRMFVPHALQCYMHLTVKPWDEVVIPEGGDEVVIPEGGVDICTESSGKFRVNNSGNGEQRTTRFAIGEAAIKIIEVCGLHNGIWVAGTKSITDSISLEIS